jgi:hypothetical protein
MLKRTAAYRGRHHLEGVNFGCALFAARVSASFAQDAMGGITNSNGGYSRTSY